MLVGWAAKHFFISLPFISLTESTESFVSDQLKVILKIIWLIHPLLPKILYSYIFGKNFWRPQKPYPLLWASVPSTSRKAACKLLLDKITIRCFLLWCFFFTFLTAPLLLLPFGSAYWRSSTAKRNWFQKSKKKLVPACKPRAEQDNKKRTQQTIKKKSVLLWLGHSCNYFCILIGMLIGSNVLTIDAKNCESFRDLSSLFIN